MLLTDAGDGDTDGDTGRRGLDRRAIDEARVAGLRGRELAAVLLGRSPTDLVPPTAGEEPHAYADRAVTEFLRLYVRRWHGGLDARAVPRGASDPSCATR